MWFNNIGLVSFTWAWNCVVHVTVVRVQTIPISSACQPYIPHSNSVSINTYIFNVGHAGECTCACVFPKTSEKCNLYCFSIAACNTVKPGCTAVGHAVILLLQRWQRKFNRESLRGTVHVHMQSCTTRLLYVSRLHKLSVQLCLIQLCSGIKLTG